VIDANLEQEFYTLRAHEIANKITELGISKRAHLEILPK